MIASTPLLPIEIGTIVHWACVDLQHAHTLVRDIEINRDVAMHRVGLPNPNALAGANAERHFERVSEFNLEHSGSALAGAAHLRRGIFVGPVTRVLRVVAGGGWGGGVLVGLGCYPDSERPAQSTHSRIVVSWRDVAMHRYQTPTSAVRQHAQLHFYRATEFYGEHPWLGEKVPWSFGEEFALCKLLARCGLPRERTPARRIFLLISPQGKSPPRAGKIKIDAN